MDFGLVGDVVPTLLWTWFQVKNVVMKTKLKGVVSYQRESQAMDFYLVQNVGHDLYFFKSPYHTDIIMIYVETLQKDFNQ